ncbi:tail fiber protein [Nocardioides sp. C4-1]|uniref:phage tail protein n=1 Tax=Nocardioides sp. C4-1 TaxID=3151851 RepID=UPI003267F13E
MSDEPFLGSLMLTAFDFAPRGWAPCDGQLLPVAQNQALFSLLGNRYGGDGVTTFALPDLRGRVPVGAGPLPGGSTYTLASSGGAEEVVLTAAQLPLHDHRLDASGRQANTANPDGALIAAGGPLRFATRATSAGVAMGPGTPDGGGGGQAHPNLGPSLVLNWVIALAGLYPSRS